jgi:hypothetical protein
MLIASVIVIVGLLFLLTVSLAVCISRSSVRTNSNQSYNLRTTSNDDIPADPDYINVPNLMRDHAGSIDRQMTLSPTESSRVHFVADTTPQGGEGYQEFIRNPHFNEDIETMMINPHYNPSISSQMHIATAYTPTTPAGYNAYPRVIQHQISFGYESRPKCLTLPSSELARYPPTSYYTPQQSYTMDRQMSHHHNRQLGYRSRCYSMENSFNYTPSHHVNPYTMRYHYSNAQIFDLPQSRDSTPDTNSTNSSDDEGRDHVDINDLRQIKEYNNLDLPPELRHDYVNMKMLPYRSQRDDDDEDKINDYNKLRRTLSERIEQQSDKLPLHDYVNCIDRDRLLRLSDDNSKQHLSITANENCSLVNNRTEIENKNEPSNDNFNHSLVEQEKSFPSEVQDKVAVSKNVTVTSVTSHDDKSVITNGGGSELRRSASYPTIKPYIST